MIKVNTINKNDDIPVAKTIEFDMKKLEYVSSSGLRVLLQTAKRLGKDNITIINANETVKEIFNVTGFDEILNIKE